MKASEIVKKLNAIIEEYGDLEVEATLADGQSLTVERVSKDETFYGDAIFLDCF